LSFNSFVEGEPVPMPKYIKIGRREQKQITLSNVMCQFIQENGFSEVMLVKLEAK